MNTRNTPCIFGGARLASLCLTMPLSAVQKKVQHETIRDFHKTETAFWADHANNPAGFGTGTRAKPAITQFSDLAPDMASGRSNLTSQVDHMLTPNRHHVAVMLASAILLAAGILRANEKTATEPYMTVAQESVIRISGTSTLHDWTIEAGLGKSHVSLDFPEDGATPVLRKLHVTVPVSSMKSGKKGMDKNTYKALHAEDHPEIIYTMHASTPLGLATNATAYRFEVSGELSIMGAGHDLDLLLDITRTANGRLMIEGSRDLKMTDLGVDPPTALLGTIRTGNAISVDYVWTLK
jgi:polyisoprenoid-binding protein YceI